MEAKIEIDEILNDVMNSKPVRESLTAAIIKAFETEQFQKQLIETMISQMDNYVDWNDILTEPFSDAVDKIDFQKIVKNIFKNLE